MSKIIPLQINNILGGQSLTEYLADDSQFQNSIGIDPELPRTDTGIKPSGILRPSALEIMSGSAINAGVVAIITQPKTTDIYVVLDNGRLVKYDKDLTNEVIVYDNLGVAYGAFYQNDYIYICYATDIARYGKLSLTPTGDYKGTWDASSNDPELANGTGTSGDYYFVQTGGTVNFGAGNITFVQGNYVSYNGSIWSKVDMSMTTGVWTGATLGSQTALTDTTYPSLLGTGQYPKHATFNHADNKTYVLDYKDSQGMVHYVKTDKDGADDNSTYNALDLPFNMKPTCGCSYATDVAIGAIQTTDDSVIQGKSAVYLWDTVDTSFYREVPISGVLTALQFKGGKLYAITGSVSGKGGHILYQYDGSLDFVPLKYIPEGYPPTAYAIDYVKERLMWGSFVSEPENACVVYAYGGLSGNAVHSIFKSNLTHTATDGMVTALKWVLQGNFATPTILTGGKNSTEFEYKLEKTSATYGTSYFSSKIFNLGQAFTIKEVTIPLATTLADNMTITAKLYIDEGSTTSTLRTINSTNFPDTKINRNIKLIPSTNASGQNNFYLELKWSGTALCPVSLPINFLVEIED